VFDTPLVTNGEAPLVAFAWDLSPWTLKILTKVQGESTKSISTSVQYVSDPPLENLDEVQESNPLEDSWGPPKNKQLSEPVGEEHWNSLIYTVKS
jgi:hypothetical protein